MRGVTMIFDSRHVILACYFAVSTWAFPALVHAEGQTYNLELEKGGNAFTRIKVLLSVDGKLKLRSTKKKLYEPPLKVAAKFYYDEKTLSSTNPLKAVRYYYTAEAKIDIDQT